MSDGTLGRGPIKGGRREPGNGPWLCRLGSSRRHGRGGLAAAAVRRGRILASGSCSSRDSSLDFSRSGRGVLDVLLHHGRKVHFVRPVALDLHLLRGILLLLLCHRSLVGIFQHGVVSEGVGRPSRVAVKFPRDGFTLLAPTHVALLSTVMFHIRLHHALHVDFVRPVAAFNLDFGPLQKHLVGVFQHGLMRRLVRCPAAVIVEKFPRCRHAMVRAAGRRSRSNSRDGGDQQVARIVAQLWRPEVRIVVDARRFAAVHASRYDIVAAVVVIVVDGGLLLPQGGRRSKGLLQLGPGRPIVERVVVVKLFAAQAEAVGVVVVAALENVRVPHQINLVGGDERKAAVGVFELQKPGVVRDTLPEKGVLLKARARDLPQKVGLTGARRHQIKAIEVSTQAATVVMLGLGAAVGGGTASAGGEKKWLIRIGPAPGVSSVLALFSLP